MNVAPTRPARVWHPNTNAAINPGEIVVAVVDLDLARRLADRSCHPIVRSIQDTTARWVGPTGRLRVG
jgi:hypothetical protein